MTSPAAAMRLQDRWNDLCDELHKLTDPGDLTALILNHSDVWAGDRGFDGDGRRGIGSHSDPTVSAVLGRATSSADADVAKVERWVAEIAASVNVIARYHDQEPVAGAWDSICGVALLFATHPTCPVAVAACVDYRGVSRAVGSMAGAIAAWQWLEEQTMRHGPPTDDERAMTNSDPERLPCTNPGCSGTRERHGLKVCRTCRRFKRDNGVYPTREQLVDLDRKGVTRLDASVVERGRLKT